MGTGADNEPVEGILELIREVLGLPVPVLLLIIGAIVVFLGLGGARKGLIGPIPREQRGFALWIGLLLIGVGIALFVLIPDTTLEPPPGTEPAEEAVPTVILSVEPSPTEPEPAVTPTGEVGPAPEQAVFDYYESINEGLFAQAWAMLTPGFRQRMNNDDFQSYEDYWGTAGLVIVKEAVVLDQSRDTARLLVRLHWTKDNRTRSYEYELVYNVQDGRWLIDIVIASP